MNKKKLLELKKITKKFGGVYALDNVDFEVYEGEIVALLGDNGAGKSTLIKIISGVLSPDSGEIYLEGKKVDIKKTIDSIKLGVETIYQDLALFDNLQASANLYMGRELVSPGLGKFIGWLNQKEMNINTLKTLKKLDISLLNNKSRVKSLSGGQRQGVAISKALLWGKKLVIMDEPTAALGVKESAKLLILIKNLINMVKGIIVISHNLEHIIDIAHRAVVLRHGRRVGELEVTSKEKHDVIHKNLISMITGKKL